ncbi:hypothetical protein [Mycobacterium phage Azrael100]|uniref:Uncharacterized protein n=1 Tax=Mycobacterium phage Cosmo TaxID=1567467 RepID=A0A0B4ZZR4_9CAUD|nr:hypothetical protein COSMO_1 [Mycobacterium phage Cosmo]WKR36014.1 hypothetical protein [Mycobacterium phage Azrael100]
MPADQHKTPTAEEIVEWLEIETPYVVSQVGRDMLMKIARGEFIGYYKTYPMQSGELWIEHAQRIIYAGQTQ